MEHQNFKKFLPSIIPAGIVFIVLGGFIAYEFVHISALTENIGSLSAELASTTANVTDLHAQTSGLSSTLSSAQENIDIVSSKVGGVEQTVGSIQKLSQIDPELLKKYSKVYFLNENYVPAHLTVLPDAYVYSTKKPEQFLTEAWPFLKKMSDAAKSDGVTLYAKSAYRSFAEQQSLKSSYTVTYGAGTANSFSADQGYSEHQLGTAVDLITTGLDGQLNGFDTTEAYQWLLSNAHRFGFTLSYPKGNGYYIYESWHWRFVGVKLATYLHTNKLIFYAMDQRDIDTYLITLFD
ncbi:MAG: M15 family metallopeptidase [Candidatus Kaiserbacteria bacterium]|nr:M15 family metallopeptidase [Candidatus Kaiserbacteria bacterium]